MYYNILSIAIDIHSIPLYKSYIARIKLLFRKKYKDFSFFSLRTENVNFKTRLMKN